VYFSITIAIHSREWWIKMKREGEMRSRRGNGRRKYQTVLVKSPYKYMTKYFKQL
jgi:hypothetical protein